MNKTAKLALLGTLLIVIGMGVYLLGVLLALPQRLLLYNYLPRYLIESIVWYSGIPIMAGIFLILTDIFLLLPYKRQNNFIRRDQIVNRNITVVLTAYNDEKSIGASVNDFKNIPLVKRVIVISNNSKDRTFEVAQAAGAIVYNEPKQGYGACVYRALSEGIKYADTDLTLLCEGDMTFRAYDIEKFMAYIPHADIVNGTRIVEQLREKDTQLSSFMYYGNFFVGKLLEIKHLGKGTFTDVGTTYKLCRNEVLRNLLPKLDSTVNLEFNAYFLDNALSSGYKLVECPVSFHKRLGVSKGGNVNNSAALKVGLKMLYGILIRW